MTAVSSMLAPHQPDLFAARGDVRNRPAVTALVPQMIAALDQRGWVGAAVLETALGADKRALREGAHRSEGRILGNQRGYILTTQATLEDVHKVTRRLLSQSNQMRDRVRQIERVRHSSCGDLGSAA
jgi:hypothetical protein